MPLHPKYYVGWIEKARGRHKAAQFTYGFFTPEAAMEHAIEVLNQGYTLLYIEQ